MVPLVQLQAFSQEFEKIALSELQEDILRRQRFRRIHQMLTESGVETGGAMKRIMVPKTHLTEEDIDKLHFKKVTIAVPEQGQQQVQTYRHPITNHHIHDHGDYWVIHDDKFPSTTMLWERERLKRDGKLEGVKAPYWIPSKKLKKGPQKEVKVPTKLDIAKATISGMPHLVGEGGPGMYYYLKGRVTGSPEMTERIQAGIDPAVLKRMERWRPSRSFLRTYPVQGPSVGGAAPVAHPTSGEGQS
jgi:hypothetical protein